MKQTKEFKAFKLLINVIFSEMHSQLFILPSSNLHVDVFETIYCPHEMKYWRSTSRRLPNSCRYILPHHTEKFENAALLLKLGLPYRLIRHENRYFRRKRSSNRRNFKMPAFRIRFRVDGEHFENGAFRKR